MLPHVRYSGGVEAMSVRASDQYSITALLPMRHFSQRVLEKNYRKFVGSPLYRHVVNALLESKQIGEIVIDTDSPTIIEDCRATYGSQIKILERPSHLCAPEIPMNRVLLNTVSQVAGDYFLQTHSTNPLLQANTISEAVDFFFKGVRSGECDSAFSVTKRQVRLWGAGNIPLNHDPMELKQTQDLEPFYEENSCLFLFSREVLMSKKNRIGDNPVMFEIDVLEALDIDDVNDFTLAESVALRRCNTEKGNGRN